MKYPSVLLFIFTVCCLSISNAQNRKLSFSGGTGVMFYSGDLTDKFLPKKKEINPHYLFTTNYKFSNVFYTSFGLVYGSVSAADSNTSKAEVRDFHFKSSIFDAHLTLGINLQELIRNLFIRDDGIRKRFEHIPLIDGPKIFGGGGFYHFNPKASYMGKWEELQPLGTEGQYLEGDYPDPYKRWQNNVVLGMEMGFKINKRIQLDVYAVYNILFTDYLDDVSGTFPNYDELINSKNGEKTAIFTYRTDDNRIPEEGEKRGNPGEKDSFSYFGLKLTYNLSKAQLDQIRHK